MTINSVLPPLRKCYPALNHAAEGLMLSVFKLLGTEMAVPDHTTVSRRAMSLPSIAEVQVPNGPLHVLIDSTGLKVYGAGVLTLCRWVRSLSRTTQGISSTSMG